MPWLSVLSNGTCAEHGVTQTPEGESLTGDTGGGGGQPTLRMKQNSELRLAESVPIWMVLQRECKVWTDGSEVGHKSV